eukprot:COSAG02_NODE_19929_length_857_cov_3.861478_1_plen_80_part_00
MPLNPRDRLELDRFLDRLRRMSCVIHVIITMDLPHHTLLRATSGCSGHPDRPRAAERPAHGLDRRLRHLRDRVPRELPH